MDPATLGRFGAVCPTDLARRSETAGRTRGGHLHNLWAIRSRFDVPLDIGRFTALNVHSPQLRLIEAMPPLKPAAEAVVRAMMSVSTKVDGPMSKINEGRSAKRL
jgi:hypothetical protein